MGIILWNKFHEKYVEIALPLIMPCVQYKFDDYNLCVTAFLRADDSIYERQSS